MTFVDWTAPAKADLARIDSYFAHADPAFADLVGFAAIAAGRFLARWPGAGPPIEGEISHKWPVKGTRYILFYRPLADRIEVLRVRHEREDWAKDL